MADYKESTVSGTAWTRAYYVSVNNPLDDTPSITFSEERAVRVETGDPVTQRLGHVIETFTPENAATLFPIMEPTTGAIISHAQYRQVYNMLHSLYLFLATKRDAATPQ